MMVLADAAGFSHVSIVSDVTHLRVRKDLAMLAPRLRRLPETDVVVVVPRGTELRSIIAGARDCMSRGCVLSMLPRSGVVQLLSWCEMSRKSRVVGWSVGRYTVRQNNLLSQG